jgi:hypothetical protein
LVPTPAPLCEPVITYGTYRRGLQGEQASAGGTPPRSPTREA